MPVEVREWLEPFKQYQMIRRHIHDYNTRNRNYAARPIKLSARSSNA
jgi:hypothetical protein